MATIWKSHQYQMLFKQRCVIKNEQLIILTKSYYFGNIGRNLKELSEYTILILLFKCSQFFSFKIIVLWIESYSAYKVINFQGVN